MADELSTARTETTNNSVLLVAGKGTASRPADTAEISLACCQRAETAAEATDRLRQVMARTIEAVKALNLAGAKLQTSSLSLRTAFREIVSEVPPEDGDAHPNAKPSYKKEQEHCGFDAACTVTVSQVSPDVVGLLIDMAARLGITTISSVDFDLRDPQSARDEALEQATRDARRRATVAAALGLRITGISQIKLGSASMDDDFQSSHVRRRSMRLMPGYDPEASWIEPGEITEDASVTIRFTLGAA